ncbi:hypothetical protein XENOCAPTIV_013661 [Xenoophorus captivus]|uniref:Secreted protein n=1 Tax=Xenoophorus captivus TaxID=1517983 RepID=A0ABV0R8V4_9TELE
MLLILVALIYCIPTAGACLQCDRTTRNMHEDFILSAPTVEDQMKLQDICDHAHATQRREARQCWTVSFHGIVSYWENRSTTTPGLLESQETKRSPTV